MSIRSDVERGLWLSAKMAEYKSELDAIEARIIARAVTGQHYDLNDPQREGSQYLAKGRTATVPVIFTADSLISSFEDGTEISKSIHEAAIIPSGNTLISKLRHFFERTVVYRSLHRGGKDFRARAAELLGDRAPDFIAACTARDKDGTPKNSVRVEWKRAQPFVREAADQCVAEEEANR